MPDFDEKTVRRYHALIHKWTQAVLRDGLNLLDAPENYGLTAEEIAEIEELGRQLDATEIERPLVL